MSGASCEESQSARYGLRRSSGTWHGTTSKLWCVIGRAHGRRASASPLCSYAGTRGARAANQQARPTRETCTYPVYDGVTFADVPPLPPATIWNAISEIAEELERARLNIVHVHVHVARIMALQCSQREASLLKSQSTATPSSIGSKSKSD